MSEHENSLSEILSFLNIDLPAERRIISPEVVKRWMQTSNPESMGAVCTVLTDRKYCMYIEPPLTRREAYDYLLRYYRMCLKENPQGEWVHGRYEAGWEIAGHLKALAREGAVAEKEIDSIVSMLRDLYLDGDDTLRNCILNAVLEHVWQVASIRAHFVDWKRNECLRVALMEAYKGRHI